MYSVPSVMWKALFDLALLMYILE